MDRRRFFKTVLLSPLLSPLFMSLKSTNIASHLYLITDSPQRYISTILQELRRQGFIYGNSFTFLNSFPQAVVLKRALYQGGWKNVHLPSKTSLVFSFSHLQKKADPSFTLVKEGKIWDIRSRHLAALWLKMKRDNNPSSLLTVASFKQKNISFRSGQYASIYKDGRKIDRISLKKKTSRIYATDKGRVAVRIEDGEAWVSKSSCRHKICCFSPPVFLAGERIICAPNHFLLEIDGSPLVDTSLG